MSLVLAIILWYFVGGEDRVDKNVMVPIEIINLPRDLVISNQFKKEIEVTVSGPRSLILEMSQPGSHPSGRSFVGYSRHNGYRERQQSYSGARGITVQRVQPSSIILSLDKLIKKKFPVNAQRLRPGAHGYYLSRSSRWIRKS